MVQLLTHCADNAFIVNHPVAKNKFPSFHLLLNSFFSWPLRPPSSKSKNKPLFACCVCYNFAILQTMKNIIKNSTLSYHLCQRFFYNENDEERLKTQKTFYIYGSRFTCTKQLNSENSSVNRCTGIHVLRTNRALAGLVSLQPINTKYCCEADSRDQWTRLVTGSTYSGQFSSCAHLLWTNFKAAFTHTTPVRHDSTDSDWVKVLCPTRT